MIESTRYIDPQLLAYECERLADALDDSMQACYECGGISTLNVEFHVAREITAALRGAVHVLAEPPIDEQDRANFEVGLP